ncbi:nucleoside hydrolase [Nocardia sp. NPDC050435]|uniref:nucleoside hydrolase n=1 Tax=Nocardia sp. NPDC050435 TaxID=3155040 RepID=UPI00340747B9
MTPIPAADAGLAERTPVRAARPLGRLPTIVCTDAGHDPDALLALVVAAITMPLRLVVTCDEFGGGQRARLVRHVLNLCGRTGVIVLAGPDTPGAGARWVCDGLVPDAIPTEAGLSTRSLAAEVHAVLGATSRAVWIGHGPMTNLAHLLAVAPPLAERLVITQTGGTMTDREPGRCTRHLRLDPHSATAALQAGLDVSLVASEMVLAPEMEVHADSEVYQLLAAPHVPRWARAVAENYARFFTRHHTSQAAGVLAVAIAAGLDFAETGDKRLDVSPEARIRLAARGIRLAVTTSVDYPVFWSWVATVLGHGLSAGAGYEPSLTTRRAGLDRTPGIGAGR